MKEIDPQILTKEEIKKFPFRKWDAETEATQLIMFKGKHRHDSGYYSFVVAALNYKSDTWELITKSSDHICIETLITSFKGNLNLDVLDCGAIRLHSRVPFKIGNNLSSLTIEIGQDERRNS